MDHQIVVFELGSELYGINIAAVEIHHQDAAHYPAAPRP